MVTSNGMNLVFARTVNNNNKSKKDFQSKPGKVEMKPTAFIHFLQTTSTHPDYWNLNQRKQRRNSPSLI